jgi:hypothetical protein
VILVRKKTQSDAVIETMENHGGFASLQYLYSNVFEIQDIVWKTKTPFASIRRIVQNKDFFFKIKPGLWALNEFREELPKNIIALIDNEKKNQDDTISESERKFTHYYYQGIFAEIGNFKNFNTYVPPQDKNKPFIDKILADLVTIEKLPEFTYPNIVQKIRSIDVIWLNNRGFPDSIIEIEHSTNFKNSLIKFSELQDFKLQMLVVAPKIKEKEYSSAIDFSVFEDIKNRVQFLDYDKVDKMYSDLLKMQESALYKI